MKKTIYTNYDELPVMLSVPDVAQIMGMNIKLDGTTTKKLSEFQDYGKIGSSSWSACQWAVDNGIINGRSEDTLDPTGLTARGQMAVILYSYLQKYYAAQ